MPQKGASRLIFRLSSLLVNATAFPVGHSIVFVTAASRAPFVHAPVTFVSPRVVGCFVNEGPTCPWCGSGRPCQCFRRPPPPPHVGSCHFPERERGAAGLPMPSFSLQTLPPFREPNSSGSPQPVICVLTSCQCLCSRGALLRSHNRSGSRRGWFPVGAVWLMVSAGVCGV